jgi:fluoroquinolone transport system ATP-binding protein
MIQVEALRFTYPGNREETLRGLTFEVADGEIFGFLGPSGAGKSTTQSVLIGLLRSFDGTVRILGEDARNRSRDFYERIGVAFEVPRFFSKFTARENLEYFRALYAGPTAEPDALLEEVDLLQDADTRVGGFSKGMQVRLNFCRAFLNRPRLVFLDEPTSGLDPVNARSMRDLILRRREEGATVMLTTHDMHAADTLCDRVAFIVDGRLELTDSPRNLRLRYGRRLVRIEARDGDELVTEELPLRGLGEQDRFKQLLAEERIETIHSQEATLEDVFIEATGRRLT